MTTAFALMRPKYYEISRSYQPEGVFTLWESEKFGYMVAAKLVLETRNDGARIVDETYTDIYEAINAYRNGSYLD